MKQRPLNTLTSKLTGGIITMLLGFVDVNAATLTWDSDTGTGGAQDGGGTWSGGTVNFWNGSANVTTADSVVTDIVRFGNGGTLASAAMVNVLPQSINGLIFDPTVTQGYVLTNTSASLLTLGSGGITMNDGVQATTVGSTNLLGLALGINQSWSNHSANSLTIGGSISGTANLIKDGTGTIAFSRANTYVGTTTINGGNLRLDLAGAIKNDANNTITINNGGSVTFGVANMWGNWGTNPLVPIIINQGGILTNNVSQATPLGAVTLNGGVLTNIGGNSNLGAYPIKGTITVGGTSPSTISGTSWLTLGGGATTSATFAVGSTGTTTDLLVSAELRNGWSSASPSAAQASKLIKTGTGTMTLTGTNSYTGGTDIQSGKLVMSGSNSLGSGVMIVGKTTENAVWEIGGGISPSATFSTTGAAVHVGATSAANAALHISRGTLTISGTSSFGNLLVGASGGFGGFTMGNTSTLNTPYMQLGGNGSGGNFPGIGVGMIASTNVVQPANATVKGYLILSRVNNGVGVLTVGTNATLNHLTSTGVAAANNIALAFAGGRGELNLTGGLIDSTGTSVSVRQGNFGSATGITNLNAGTLIANSFTNTGGTAYLNFNGGTLKAGAAGATIIPNTMTGVYINSGGAVIDTNNASVTVSAALLAPAGNGVATPHLLEQGAGYITAPYVAVSGTGTGATAIANMVSDGAGKLKVGSVTITNPGIHYTGTPEITFTGGGATTPAVTDTVVTAANPGGGLTKTNAGTLILAGANTYTGDTTVSGGTLELASTGKLLFKPTSNGTSNKITGNASLALRGTLDIDLSDAEAVVGNSWSLVDAGTLSETYDTVSFSVSGFTRQSNIWEKPAFGLVWTFSQADGVLTAAAPPPGYTSWIATYPVGDFYKTDDDADHDGLPNLMEYALGGDPTIANTSILPQVNVTESTFEFTYSRLDLSLLDTHQIFEYAGDLGGFTSSIPIPISPGSSSNGTAVATVTDNDPGSESPADSDTVTVSIPKNAFPTGMIFGRLKAVR